MKHFILYSKFHGFLDNKLGNVGTE